MSSVKDFLKRKDIVITPQRYLIEALGAMAQGLFASLLIGTIIKTLGQQTGLEVLVDLGGYASAMSGPAMACAIGWALHCPPLVLFSLITVGYSANALGGAGGPLAVLIIAIAAAELGKAVSKETKVDILVTPLVTIFAGVGLSMLIAAPIGAAASQVGTLIMWATEQAPLVMGILVSVIVGVALTLPISSAAICAALGLTGLAGGAAVAGCCAQMVGFAVMSYKENGVGGLVSQGLGTSMLQMGNIIKNPRIWIAPTLASAITGPLATCLFRSGPVLGLLGGGALFHQLRHLGGHLVLLAVVHQAQHAGDLIERLGGSLQRSLGGGSGQGVDLLDQIEHGSQRIGGVQVIVHGLAELGAGLVCLGGQGLIGAERGLARRAHIGCHCFCHFVLPL